ncbi:MAG: hypothetical protein ACOYI2_06340 [Bacillota bacterium]|jgi:hypothetical protein
MCQYRSVPISQIMDNIISQRPEVFNKGNMLLERLKARIRQAPVTSLEYLFYQYRVTDKLTDQELTNLFHRIAPECYLSYVMFINSLCPGKLMLLETQVKNLLVSSLESALENCSVPLTGQNRIMQALVRLRQTGLPEEIQNLNLTLTFDPCEVINNLDYYLQDADTLADLPEFAEIYFPPEKIHPIALQLENYRLNPFGKKYIAHLIDTKVQETIKKTLEHFIENFPVKQCTKQAFAVLMTLGRLIPWEKHPFILRLVANSYWEQKVLSYI